MARNQKNDSDLRQLNMKNLLLMVVILASILPLRAEFGARNLYFRTTGFAGGASASINTRSASNIMIYVRSGRTIVPSMDIENDQAALCPLTEGFTFGDSVYSYDPNFVGLWDGTNNSTTFPTAVGNRMANVLDITNSSPFFASSITAYGRSSDASNIINSEINLGEPGTAFSSVIQGELVVNGITNRFKSGLLATQPVTRVIIMLRYGYAAGDNGGVLVALNNYATNIASGPWTHTHAWVVRNEAGQVVYAVTNSISNLNRVDVQRNGTNTIVTVRGERVRVTYNLEGSPLVTGGWQADVANVPGGFRFLHQGQNIRFWRAKQNLNAGLTGRPKSFTSAEPTFTSEIGE